MCARVAQNSPGGELLLYLSCIILCTTSSILPAGFDSDVGTIGSVFVTTGFKEGTALR